MPTLEESSLDRYLEGQAGLLLSHASLRRGMIIMRIVGVIMLLMTLGVLITALAKGEPSVLAGAIGPGIGGLVNIVASRSLRNRTKPAMEVNANLTPEARNFLGHLMKDVYGWPRAWGAVEPHFLFEGKGSYMNRFDRRRERRAWRSMLASGSWGKRQHAAKEMLNAEAFDILNRAAFQYNRISGIIGVGNQEVSRFSASVKGAADQAMADVFHAGYLLEEFPEGSAAAKAKAEQEITALSELAGKLEEMQSQSITAPSADVLSTSPVASVLEELRLDQLARSELNKPVEEKRVDLRQGP